MHFNVLNENRFKHAFDCLSPVCVCGKDNGNNKHFLQHRPLYDVLRRGPSDLPGRDVTSVNNLDDDTLCYRLSSGDASLGTIGNRVILEATNSFINISGQFD